MSYSYKNASTYRVEEDAQYLIDSNIWLKVLIPKNDLSRKDKEYLKLFDDIVKSKARIVLPALVVSEVVNRIIRDVHMNKFKKKLIESGKSFRNDNSFYKLEFRPSEEFKIAYTMICDDIKAYHSSVDLINDEFGTSIKSKHVLNQPPKSLDFNDNFYYQLCKKKGYVLLTDDKDFWVKDIKVITLSKTLLDKEIAFIQASKKVVAK